MKFLRKQLKLKIKLPTSIDIFYFTDYDECRHYVLPFKNLIHLPEMIKSFWNSLRSRMTIYVHEEKSSIKLKAHSVNAQSLFFKNFENFYNQKFLLNNLVLTDIIMSH